MRLRILREKAGLSSPYLEQLATFAGPTRDPRGWSVSVAYYALVPPDGLNQSAPVSTCSVDSLVPVPFDHGEIVSAATARLRSKSQYSSLPVHLLGESFSLRELQTVYETVLGEPIHHVAFRRKMQELGVLEPIAGAVTTGRAHRPAQLYRVLCSYRRTLSLLTRGIGTG